MIIAGNPGQAVKEKHIDNLNRPSYKNSGFLGKGGVVIRTYTLTAIRTYTNFGHEFSYGKKGLTKYFDMIVF